MKILSVFGTRPEAIKMAMLVKKLQAWKGCTHYVCVTAQHREMLDQVLEFFNIKADIDLNIMQTNQSLSAITSLVLNKITQVYIKIKPDLVFVHGDTTTCMTASLAAFHLKIKVAHIEAGMRTGNIFAPYPEEVNRMIADKLSTYHFAPGKKNISNLLNENIPPKNIIETGNTVIDALLYTSKKMKTFSSRVVNKRFINAFKSKNKIILVTGHRRENFGNGFLQICEALKYIAKKYPEIFIIYPVHLNPNVKKTVEKLLSNIKNIILTKPLAYNDFVFAMKKSWIIITDSGGIQEEAPSLGKPVLLMRNVTERPEAVETGSVKLVGANSKKICSQVIKLINDPAEYKKMSVARNPYGDGRASERILKWLKKNKKNILATHL